MLSTTDRSDAADPRTFYARAWLYLTLAALAAFLGFFPSYFGRLGDMDAAYHVHGITAALWMVLLVVQPLLHRLGRWDLHRAAGKASFVLVPLVVVGGLAMVHRMVTSPDRYPSAMAYQLAYIDFYVLVQFVLFFALAMGNRRDVQLHGRYMVATVFGILVPALTRLFLWLGGAPSFGMALHLSYVAVHAVIIALLLHDFRTGRVRTPYPLALGLMLFQHLTMTFAGDWSWWGTLMQAYGRIYGG